MRTEITRRRFIEGALGTMAVTAVGSVAGKASAETSFEGAEILSQPIIIDAAWVAANGPVLEDRTFVVGDDFTTSGNAAIEIRTSGVTLRNIRLFGLPRLPFAYTERWDAKPGGNDNLPGVHPKMSGIIGFKVDDIAIESCTVAGFPTQALWFETVNGLQITDFEFHHVLNGIMVRSSFGPSTSVYIQRVRGHALWDTNNSPRAAYTPYSRERHGARTGKDGLILRGVIGGLVEDFEMVGDHLGNKINRCSQLKISRFVGAEIQLATHGSGDTPCRDIVIEDCDFSRMRQYGPPPIYGNHQLHVAGDIQNVSVRRCRFMGGRGRLAEDATTVVLDGEGRADWRPGHAINLSHEGRRESWPTGIRVEDCVFYGHNAEWYGGIQHGALRNVGDDGTADQTERLVGGTSDFLANNHFVQQDVRVIHHDHSTVRSS